MTSPRPTVSTGDPLRRVADLLWMTVPSKVARLSPMVGGSLADSGWLTRWPILAILAAPAALLLGLYVGTVHPSSADVFTTSLLVTTVLLVVAVIGGAGVGVLITVGYAFGDYFLYPEPANRYTTDLSGALGLRLGLFVSYCAMFLLLANVPLLCSMLRRRAAERAGGGAAAVVVSLAAQVLVGAAFAYAWSQAIPLMLRPMFVWPADGQPPYYAVQPIQANGMVLAVAAGVAGIAHIVLVRWAGEPRFVAPTPLIDRIGLVPARLLRAFTSALIFTVLFAGLANTWIDRLMLYAFVQTAALLRFVVLPAIPAYGRALAKVPIILRLIATVAGGVAVGYVLLAPIYNTGTGDTLSFRPILISIGVGFVLGALLLPDTARREGE